MSADQRANNLRARAQAAEARALQAQARTSFAELADVLDNLGPLAYKTRATRQLSLRAAANAIGISSTTLHRIERGDGAHSHSAALILRWLDTQKKESTA